jgi:hypothetical protein
VLELVALAFAVLAAQLELALQLVVFLTYLFSCC